MPDQKNDILITRLDHNNSNIIVEGSKRLDACGDTIEDVRSTGRDIPIQFIDNATT